MTFKRLDLICQDVVSQMNTEGFGGSEPIRACQDEERTRPAGEKIGGRVHPQEQGGSPRIETGKPRTRSRDGWTVPKPRKKAPAETGASVSGGSQREARSRTSTTIHLIHTNEAPLKISRCERIASKAESPTPAMRSHLRIVWSDGHLTLANSPNRRSAAAAYAE